MMTNVLLMLILAAQIIGIVREEQALQYWKEQNSDAKKETARIEAEKKSPVRGAASRADHRNRG